MLAGRSYTVALLCCIIAMRLLKEMRPLDFMLSQHAISEFVLYMCGMIKHMERIDGRMPPAQSCKNIRE